MESHSELTFEIVSGAELSAALREEIIDLCSVAYEEDFRPYIELLPDPVHLLARRAGALVSHAAWVTRWLQAGEGELLRTAYVEAVATAPEHQRRGYASAVMRRLIPCIQDFDIAALSPFDFGYYERLGWEAWRGPRAVRTAGGLELTPDEDVMIYRLPRTPEIDVNNLLTVEWRPGEVW